MNLPGFLQYFKRFLRKISSCFYTFEKPSRLHFQAVTSPEKNLLNSEYITFITNNSKSANRIRLFRDVAVVQHGPHKRENKYLMFFLGSKDDRI